MNIAVDGRRQPPIGRGTTALPENFRDKEGCGLRLHVLSVGYPFAPVSHDAVGGAEQVLATLDQALVRRGHRSVAIAARGSRVAGELLDVVRVDGEISDSSRTLVYKLYEETIRRALDSFPIDLVHMHGVDFHRYLPDTTVPVLVTLHLPPERYPREFFARVRPGVTLQCVSASQRRTWWREAESPLSLDCVENGVPVEAFTSRQKRRGYAVILARICEEKGIHLALEAMHRAGLGLYIGGEVFPYRDHVEYFANRVRPLLDAQRRFLGPVGFVRKRALLAAARCVLIPSLIAETSSLVAMEALASGTRVVAFHAGALTEIVDHGRTGFLVRDTAEMADAVCEVDRLDREECRATARARFSADAMVERYVKLYRRMLGEPHTPGEPPAALTTASAGTR